ncbi:MAG: sigma-70 family RNA polymerase sigma factor [Planctomycetaceae bacterium]|nr:sigma-70 family RNA polymerase sigma factor [Planctomycetaceae bacterium]
MEPDHERELTTRMRAGDGDAWRGLYDAYAEPVWRVVARQMGPGAADVADVVQETFLAAARSARSFDPERGTIWYWLCGIARRHVALYYRKQQRHDRIRQAAQCLHADNGQALTWLESREPPPAKVLESAELATIIRATLTELSDDYGTLLATRYLDGVPVERIADAEQTSATAVRSKLARARAAFRAAFGRLTEIPRLDVLGEPHEA